MPWRSMPCLIKHRVLKTYWGSEGIAPHILNLGNGGEKIASRPGRFTSGVKSRRYPLDRRLGGPQSRSGHGDEDKKSHQCPYRESNPCRPASSIVSIKIPCAFFNRAPRHEGVLGSGGITPRTLDLDTIWWWMVSFTPRPLYARLKSPWYLLDGRLCGPQRRAGRVGKE
jgi:hypothetical protein